MRETLAKHLCSVISVDGDCVHLLIPTVMGEHDLGRIRLQDFSESDRPYVVKGANVTAHLYRETADYGKRTRHIEYRVEKPEILPTTTWMIA